MKTKRLFLLAAAVLMVSLSWAAGMLTLPYKVGGKNTFEQGEAVKVKHYGKTYTAYELKGIARSGHVYWIPSQKRLLFDCATIDQIKTNELVSCPTNIDVLIWFNGNNIIKCNTLVYTCGKVSLAGDSNMNSTLKLQCLYPIVAKTQAYVSFIDWNNVNAETLVSSCDGTKMDIHFESVKGVLRATDHLFPHADMLMLTRCGLKADSYGLEGKNTLVYDRRDGKVKLYKSELKTLVLTYEDDYYPLDSSDKRNYVYDLRSGGVTKGTKTLEKEEEEAQRKQSATAASSQSGNTSSGHTTPGRGSARTTTSKTTTTGTTTVTRRPSTGNTSSGTRRSSASKRKTN